MARLHCQSRILGTTSTCWAEVTKKYNSACIQNDDSWSDFRRQPRGLLPGPQPVIFPRKIGRYFVMIRKPEDFYTQDENHIDFQSILISRYVYRVYFKVNGSAKFPVDVTLYRSFPDGSIDLSIVAK